MAETIVYNLSALSDKQPDHHAIIRIEASDDVRQIPQAWLASPNLVMIEIDFPNFRDGRGFSSARILRSERLYQGPLKAVGDVLRDQLFVMMRSGFDRFALKDPKPDEALDQAKQRFRQVYQKSSDQRQSIAALRSSKL